LIKLHDKITICHNIIQTKFPVHTTTTDMLHRLDIHGFESKTDLLRKIITNIISKGDESPPVLTEDLITLLQPNSLTKGLPEKSSLNSLRSAHRRRN